MPKGFRKDGNVDMSSDLDQTTTEDRAEIEDEKAQKITKGGFVPMDEIPDTSLMHRDLADVHGGYDPELDPEYIRLRALAEPKQTREDQPTRREEIEEKASLDIGPLLSGSGARSSAPTYGVIPKRDNKLTTKIGEGHDGLLQRKINTNRRSARIKR